MREKQPHCFKKGHMMLNKKKMECWEWIKKKKEKKGKEKQRKPTLRIQFAGTPPMIRAMEKPADEFIVWQLPTNLLFRVFTTS